MRVVGTIGRDSAKRGVRGLVAFTIVALVLRPALGVPQAAPVRANPFAATSTATTAPVDDELPIHYPDELTEAKRRANTEAAGQTAIGRSRLTAGALPLLGGGAALSANLVLELVTDFPGIAFDATVPPDPVIAAGPAHLLAVTNGTVTVFRKDGTLLSETTLAGFFDSVSNGAEFITDPRIVFDSGRFFVSAGTLRRTPFASSFVLAVSTSSDPTADFNFYTFNAALDNETPTTNFADIPSLGVDDNAVYIAANMFDFANNNRFQYVKIRDIKKAPLLNGAAASFFDFTNLRVGETAAFAVQPAQSLGSTSAEYLLDTRFPDTCALTVWRVTNPPAGSPRLDRADMPLFGDCSMPPDASQKDSAQRVDTGFPRIINAVWRAGSLWGAATVGHNWGSGNVSTIRVFQINTSSFPVLSLTQDFLQGADGVHVFYPVVTVDAAGDVLLGFNQSSASEYVSAQFAGQTASAPRNMLLPSGLLKAGLAPYVQLDSRSQNRWGDYNGLGVDPLDKRFWMVGEYADAPSNRWGTWIGSLAFVTPTPTATSTATPTRTATSTRTGTPTRTPTPTRTETGPTRTRTPTATSTLTATGTETPTETATPTPTSTCTPTETQTYTPTETDTPTETPSITPTETSTPTEPPTATPTETPSPTPTDLPSATPTPEPPTFTPTATLTPSPTPLVGDVNHDGRVDGLDLALVIRHMFVITDTPKNPNADVNHDGRVTAPDAVAVVIQIQ